MWHIFSLRFWLYSHEKDLKYKQYSNSEGKRMTMRKVISTSSYIFIQYMQKHPEDILKLKNVKYHQGN